MESYLSIFQGILSADEHFLDIYLDGLDEHRKFCTQSNQVIELVQHITSLLTKSTTRALGLRFLAKFTDQCPIDVFEKKGNLWTTLVIKACNNHELERDAPLIFDVLSKIIRRSQQVPDLTKSFASTHLFKVYDSLINVPPSQAIHVLSCIETCLKVYPGSSGPARGVIERILWKHVDHIDIGVVNNCGKCLNLLQQVKGGGINHKMSWKNYQCQLLGAIHVVYNEMFSNCVEIYDDNVEQNVLPLEKERLVFDNDPVKKAAQMYTRCRNLIKFLIIALREPFAVEKQILLKKILNVVTRGLGVNCIMLDENAIADNIALSILLPKLHIHLLELLNVVIIILHGHLRPYSELILGLLMDTLKWTSIKNIHGEQRPLLNLRKKVYETVSLWCKILNSGSRCNIIAEYLFQEILYDITPRQSEFTLKVLSGTRKHVSKKARRLLHNAQNEKSNMAQNHSTDNSTQKKDLSEERNQVLCISALHCLQDVLFSVANFVKPTILKLIQTNIIQTAAIFYELPSKSTQLYYNKYCRIEIYNTLYAILMTPHHLCPPPTEIALTIIRTALVRDVSCKVRMGCALILQNIEKLFHPQKESLLFAIEARDIRNEFIKMGKESLLNESVLHFSNTSFNNHDNVDDDDDDADNNENNELEAMVIPISADIESVENNNCNANDDDKAVGNLNDFDKEQVTDKDSTFSEPNFDNIPKSPEFVLPYDNGDIAAIDEDKINDDRDIDEPIKKKQKLQYDNDEAIKLQINETDVYSYDNIEETEDNILADIDNIEETEDNILADIESQFVDELN